MYPRILHFLAVVACAVSSNSGYADKLQPTLVGFNQEVSKRYGFLLVDSHVQRTVSAWTLSAQKIVPLRPPIGRQLKLIKLRPGKYSWKSISVPYFDLPHILDLQDDDRWSFTVERGVINYAGTLFVGEERGRALAY